MTPASLVGFGAVFVLVAFASSALLVALVPVLGRRGPAAERRAAGLAAVLPVVLAVAVVAVLVGQSLLGVDHCDHHGHHAHLCLAHGTVWVDRAWAVATVAVGGAVVAARAIALVWIHVAGRRRVARLQRVVGASASPDIRVASDVRVVRSERAFCFVAGLVRPRIYVSTTARDALDADEFRAMLAHEASHVAHRDLARRLGLDLLLLFAAPLAGIVVRERWELATERLRDSDAARSESPEAVASALVRMARLGSPVPRGVAAFVATAEAALHTRVTALLDDAPRGELAARRIGRVVGAIGAVVIVLAVLFADPLHHALETLLG